jgi:uncharacterized membrane protein
MVRPMIRRISTAVAFATALLAVGCFGAAHNPGYFPWMLPGGDIIRTHAKPPGAGYYKNFDPKAQRIDVTPDTKTIRPKCQQVLIATVYDKDGQPRRGRRVEWILEGPGSIVEVNESGHTAGRGYKVDNKYAVTSTDYWEHTINRGNNNDPKDDVTIGAGQTWCVITSAVPGETVVTAYAPEIFNSDKGRAYAKIQWSDNEFAFPPPISARYGGEASLQTTITHLAEQAGIHPDEVKVRYRILGGGAPATLLAKNGSGTQVSGARGGSGEVDILADDTGIAGVRVIQPKPVQGKTQIAVEVVKPDANGVGPGTVVGRATTTVDWTAPQLTLDVQAPKVIALDREATIAVVASNPGSVDTSPVNVQVRLPEGLEVVSVDPPPTVRNGSVVTWSAGAITSTRKQEFRITVKTSRMGSYTTIVDANTEDGLTAQARGTMEAGASAMQLKLDPPILAATGERVPIRFTVTNPSSVPLENTTAYLYFEPGLEHDTGKEQIDASVGVIPAGGSKTMDIPLIAKQAGKFKVRVTVTAGTGTSLRESGETTVEVKKAELNVVIGGPEKILPGEEATFEYKVTNAGEIALPNVSLKTLLPQAILTAKTASDTGSISGPETATWNLGSLAPGERKSVKLTVVANRQSDPVKITATAISTKSDPSAVKPGDTAPDPKGLMAKTDRLVAVVGQPALVMELADPQQAVPVGRRAAYKVTVKNRGTGAAKDIAVNIELPPQYANMTGKGAKGEDVRPDGSRLTFPTVSELQPNATLVFYFEVEGAQAGDARVRAEVKADYLAQPLREEQATRVIEAK